MATSMAEDEDQDIESPTMVNEDKQSAASPQQSAVTG